MGFKELDGVSRGVIKQNLFAALAGNDVVPEVGAGIAELLNFAREIVDFQLDTVPAPGFRPAV